MTRCSVEGCPSPVFVKARGLCKKHYHRWWRHGDPLAAKYDRASGTDMQRWWAKVNRTDTCWLWIGGLDRHGYGEFTARVDGKQRHHRAHRWGYQQLVRPLADEETMDHLCRVHACVNPDHLEPVTHAENVARGESGSHNASKTHCKQGHEFTPENTYLPPRGGRECKTCAKATSAERMRRYRAKKRAAERT